MKLKEEYRIAEPRRVTSGSHAIADKLRIYSFLKSLMSYFPSLLHKIKFEKENIKKKIFLRDRNIYKVLIFTLRHDVVE